MEKPTISLCMIVRDEEEHLAKCLSSVLRIVDEIIIVDTGSTDETVSIAHAFGAKVISIPWPGSFATARNRSLMEATCDWILWLDADEVMDVEESGKLKELLTREAVRTGQIEGIQFVFLNYVEGGVVQRMGLQRMFRNRPEYRFEGRIHEHVAGSMKRHNPHIQFGQVDIHVYHYGYMAEHVVRKHKSARNVSLLLRELADDPSQYSYHFYLGEELSGNDQIEDALDHLNIYLDHPGDTPTVMQSKAHKLRLEGFRKLGRMYELVQQSRQSIARFPEFTDLYHFPFYGWYGLGNPEKGLGALERALRLGPASTEYSTLQGIGSYLTCLDIGQLHESTSQLYPADLYYTLASLRSERLVVSLFTAAE